MCVYLHSCSADMLHKVQMVELATSLVTQVVQASAASETVGLVTCWDWARTVAQSCSSARKPLTASKLVTNHSTTLPQLSHHNAVTRAEQEDVGATVYLSYKTERPNIKRTFQREYCLWTPDFAAVYHLWHSSLRLLTPAVRKCPDETKAAGVM